MKTVYNPVTNEVRRVKEIEAKKLVNSAGSNWIFCPKSLFKEIRNREKNLSLK